MGNNIINVNKNIKKLLIIDFDQTIFDLKIDWFSLKDKLSSVLRIKLKDNFLDEIKKLYIKKRLSYQLVKKLDEITISTESKGVDCGKVTKLGKYIDEYFFSNSQILTVVVSRNSIYAIQQALMRFFINSPDLIIGRSSVIDYLKPSKRIFNKIKMTFRKYNFKEIVVVGDSNIDKKFANNISGRFIKADKALTTLLL
jgi:phosphoglycolate phosphatase-like HAD superfamily hydrolase